MTTPMTPRTPRASALPRGAGLAVGDVVTLPEGQRAVLRFVGKIRGKPGEYAGVELIDEFKSQGRHSGTYEGINYFTTSEPNTGLFITYTKLIGSTVRTTPLANRQSTLLHPTRAQPAPSPSRRSQVPQNGAAVRPRPSLVPSTPNRGARTSMLVSPSARPLLRESPAKARSAGPQNSSALEANLSTLTKELQAARATIAEKDIQLEEQIKLLHDVEESLNEFQLLAKSEEQEQQQRKQLEDEAMGPYDIDTLLKSIEDRDRKLNSLRSEFDHNRAEFRLTIDSLQADMVETAETYEQEIRNLKDSMGQAEVIHSRIAELELMVSQLEKGLESSQMSEQNARKQLYNLADIENRLLEKEQELKEASSSLEHYRETLHSLQERPENSGDSPEAEKIKSLEETVAALQSQNEELLRQLDEQSAPGSATTTESTELTSLREELDAKNARVKELESLVAESQKSSKSRNEQLELELRKLKEEHNSRVKELQAGAGSSKQEHESELRVLQEELDLSRKAAESAGVYKQQLKDLQNQHSNLQESSQKNIEKLTAESSQLSSELSSHKTQLQQLQQQHNETSSLLEQSRAVNKNVEATGQDNEALEKYKAELDSEKQRVEKLQDDLDSVETMLEAKILRETELEDELRSLQHQLASQAFPSKHDDSVLSASVSPPSAPNTPNLTSHLSPIPSGDIPVYKSPVKQDPAAGRALWCGLCEREGHESLDCPYVDEDEEF